ncbi:MULTISPECIES: FctA domain-containing protein [unclassified Breznakia]|uniref:DUF7601 domain-containing protein n=1 Tax=unclassified Breznakia TaxID=2623764 RepID=UPI002475C2A2|nr:MULTISPECIES: FctA domain-containing protein [unclassified Breznakia]MDH6367843.1 hypothetical protein [Breznakia sp. PH1-1]MDH6404910.1 hypothetical protein [Breznakia sp. PF1-11]MDH6412646.1 hypothetical protein [Breznakia sp. PFB1-11]MDH6414985.1 hypothetical protein [Breznakia sp. PFB1-14]MDH6417296.1 hypothetical protein [Breznakia sp. PFB1-4]
MKQKSSRWKSLSLVLLLCMAIVGTTKVEVLRADVIETTDPVIISRLVVADGIEIPSVKFKYDFEAIDYNDTTDVSSAPNINSVFSSMEDADKQLDTTSGSYVVEKSVTVPKPAGFTKPGVYTYTIKEEAAAYNTTGSQIEVKGMNFDPAEYKMRVYVKLVSGQFQIDTITIEKDNEKVDGSATEKGLLFTNVLKKTAGSNGPELTDANKIVSFSVQKNVEGEYGDLNKAFEFKLTFGTSPTETETGNYTYYIVDMLNNGAKVSSDELLTLLPNNTREVIVNLKHGQRVVFLELPAGTTVSATETHDAKYTGSYDITQNGVEKSGKKTLIGDDLYISYDDDTSKPTVLGESTNKAYVTNTHIEVNFTGFVVDNFPFMVLIVVGAIGLYMALRNKRTSH